jgi:hypothetical protein
MRSRFALVFLLALVGCAGSVDGGAGDGENAISRIGPPIVPHISITLDSIEPAVEGRPTIAHFTISNLLLTSINGNVKSTVSPVGSAPYAGNLSFPITSLGFGGAVSGVVSFVAPPAAHANTLEVFYEDKSGSRTSAGAQPLDVAARYDIGASPVEVINPRGKTQDDVYVAFAADNGINDALPNGTGPSAFGVQSTGTVVNGGQTVPGISGRVDVVPDVGSVNAAVIAGNWFLSAEKVVSLSAEAFALAKNQTTSASVATALTGTVNNEDAVCDGPVAVDRRSFSGRDLLDGTPNFSVFAQDAVYAATTPTPYAFCGETAHYAVTWRAARVPAGADNNLSITPPLAVSWGGRSVQFTAHNGDVDWFVDGGAANGFIDATGRYTPPAGSIENKLVTVRAQIKGSGTSTVAYVTGGPNLIVHLPPAQ